jgi:hypothetical protein
MPKQMRFPLSEVTKLQDDLERLPDAPPRALSRREAIVRLAPQIKALQSKGYTLAAIAAVLTEKGFPVTEEVLKKGHVKPATGKKGRRRSGGQAARGTSRRAASEPASPPPSAAEPSAGPNAALATTLPKPGETAAGQATKTGPFVRPAGAEPSTAATGTSTAGPIRPGAPPSGWTGSVAVGGSVATGSGAANSPTAGVVGAVLPGKVKA